MPARQARRKYYVDKKVQGALLIRAARYWVLSITVVSALTILGWLFWSPGIAVLIQLREQLPSLLGTVLVALMASLVVLPVILLDLVRMTNRFVGPMLRLRRSMRQAAAGEKVAPVKFRGGDYWEGFADDFNLLLDRLNQGSSPSTNGPTGKSEPSATMDVLH